MASTAATVFFCRAGRVSLRALLTGFLIGPGVAGAAEAWAAVAGAAGTDAGDVVVCAIADIANTSSAGVRKSFFIFFSSGTELGELKRIARVLGCAPPHGRRVAMGIQGQDIRAIRGLRYPI